MNGKSILTDMLLTAGVLMVFTAILAVGNIATAAKSPADFTVNQFTASVDRPSAAVQLAQFTNPPAGTMLGGAGIFAPPGILNPPGGSGGMFFVPDPEYGVPLAPVPAASPYRRCPYGGFDCDL
jgi:hypothetical protein